MTVTSRSPVGDNHKRSYPTLATPASSQAAWRRAIARGGGAYRSHRCAAAESAVAAAQYMVSRTPSLVTAKSQTRGAPTVIPGTIRKDRYTMHAARGDRISRVLDVAGGSRGFIKILYLLSPWLEATKWWWGPGMSHIHNRRSTEQRSRHEPDP